MIGCGGVILPVRRRGKQHATDTVVVTHGIQSLSSIPPIVSPA
jgi:hypothetical protein